MVFLSYNLFLYRYNKGYDAKLNIFKKHFPGKDYLLPYSQLSKDEIATKIKCDENELTGLFVKDLDFIMKKCSGLAVFPTKNNYIGLGTYWEIISAEKYGLEKLVYNSEKDIFYNKFKIKEVPKKIKNATFYKKIIFLD